MKLVPVMDPILRKKTDDLSQDEIEGSKQLFEDMLLFLRTNGGIGLAAPQVGVSKSVFVIRIDDTEKVFINPSVISTSEDTETQEESCLSIPGLRLKIRRPTRIQVAWISETGEQQVADLEGLWARCWLHEFDHLQGILIDDRVSKLALDMAKRKLIKRIKNLSRRGK